MPSRSPLPTRLIRLASAVALAFALPGSTMAWQVPVPPGTVAVPPLPAAPVTDPTALAIERQLDRVAPLAPTPLPMSESPARIDLVRAERDFYAERRFLPAWTDARDVTQLVDGLRGIATDGLDPADYPIDALSRQSVQAHLPDASPTQRAAVDLALTHAFLSALVELRRGKVDPASIERQWNFDPAEIYPQRDLYDILHSVNTHDVATAFRRASPENDLYQRLRDGLAQLIQRQTAGGWPTIGSGVALKPGMQDDRVPALRQRLVDGGYLAAGMGEDTTYDATTAAATKQFQQEQYLLADGTLGASTIAALNVPVDARIDQVRVNMERARWLLHKLQGTFVVVDIAGYKVAMYRDGKPIWRSIVQVGKPFRSTPVFQAEITYITFNPTWTVPPTILINDILPKIRKNPGYLAVNHIQVLDTRGQVIAPASVDWQHPRGITLRQEAGPDNSLGQVVIRFPNAYAVYLHDTPHRDLFSQQRRATSSGCIRVEHPLELVEHLFNDPVHWNAAAIQAQLADGKTTNITLPVKVPVLLAYWTVDVTVDGRVTFKQDVYGHDAAVLAALRKPPAASAFDLN